MKSYQRLLLAAVVSGGLALASLSYASSHNIQPTINIAVTGGSVVTVKITATNPNGGAAINDIPINQIQVRLGESQVGSSITNGSGNLTNGWSNGSITGVPGTYTKSFTPDLDVFTPGCNYTIWVKTNDSDSGFKNGQWYSATFCIGSGDTTPPVVGCLPTTNPSGKNVPTAGTTAGNSGQNPDGFYELVATDNVTASSDIVVYIKDSVSGYEVEGLTSGAKFKLIQAPGVTPKVKQMKGYVQIQFQGDAIVFGYDEAGNRSLNHECLVPRSPK